MKKLIALFLCLILILPVIALAETETTTLTQTIDLIDITMNIGPNDLYDIAPTKADNQVFAIIYPNYDATAVNHANINLVWSSANAAAEIAAAGGIETYSQDYVQQIVDVFASMGIVANDAQLLGASFEENYGVIYTYMLLDYTGAGVALTLDQYQMQVYFCDETEGTYIITLTASTPEEMETLLPYLETIKFK